MTSKTPLAHKDEIPRIYATIARGVFPSVVITPAHHRELRRYLKKQVAKISSDVTRHHTKGRNRNAARMQSELFRGCAARFVAAFTADIKLARRERKIGRKNRQRSFADIFAVAEKLKDVHSTAEATISRKSKKSGGYRLLYAADMFGIAKQALFVNAIRPFASFHPSQYQLRGGRSAACKNLLNELNQPANCNTRFIQFDVSDFFGSISREYVEEVIPAPKAIIRNALFMEGWRITGNDMGDTIRDRRGLPQGSAASSFVAEWVMANVIRELADQLAPLRCLHFYSDNWGGFVPHSEDVEALVGSLKDAFQTHRAGPYRLTCHDPGQASFSFLGYYFEPQRDGRRARASLPKGVARQKKLEFVSELLAADTMYEVMQVYAKVAAFCSAFSLAPEAGALHKRMASLVLGQLKSQLAQMATANKR